MVPDTVKLLLLALGLGLLVEWGVYRMVRKPHMLAQPNERSSHSHPTPTMGGLVVVLAVLVYLACLAREAPVLGWGLFGALAAVAVVGLWDDLAGLSAGLRLAVHLVAGTVVIACMQLELHPGAALLCLGALVWLVNLYNFMDGIDGYAAVQCLVFCMGVQVVSGGLPGWTGELVWLLAGATLAFLAFNWPPAKIFMGDVGSGFIGLLVGVLVLYLWRTGDVPLVASLILLAGFWFDATYTLCVRILTKQEVIQAHRQHLYQHVAMRRGHLWTTSAFLFYAVLWLMPMAYFAAHSPGGLGRQALALFAAVLPLAVLCYGCRAGTPGNGS